MPFRRITLEPKLERVLILQKMEVGRWKLRFPKVEFVYEAQHFHRQLSNSARAGPTSFV